MESTENGLQEWLLKDVNESTIEDEELSQTLAKEVANDIEVDTRAVVEKIATIWMEMGLSSHETIGRIKEIKELHLTLNKNSLNTENSSLKKLIEFNETKLKEINVILEDLTLPSFIAPTDRSLKQIGRILVYKHSELEALKRERLNQLTKLMAKRDQLLAIMNMKSKEWRTATNIPSDEELMHLQSYVSDLTKDRSKRFNKYQTLRKLIEDLFKELDRAVISDFEKHLIFEDSDKFVLSDDHMKAMQSLLSELENSYQQNNNKRKLLEKKLESLWDRLEVDQTYRDIFYRNKKGSKPSVLALLEEEVIKYEELKRQNIEMFVHKVRKELEEWYERCYESDEQKDKFKEFMESNEFSEELLEYHELELQRVQTYYEECEKMLKKVEEWQNKWQRYQELENKANDPNRFNNRGGALLREEREKNQIKKDLPKLENELKGFSEKQFKQKAKHFAIFGIPIKAYLENQKMEYQDWKENGKKERQRQKQMELNAQLRGKKVTPGGGGVVLRKTPVKRAFTPVSPGPNGSSSSKVRRIGAPLTPLRDEINKQTQTKRINPNNGRPVPSVRARNLEAQLNQMADTPNIEGSMLSINEDEFQAPLQTRDDANSTFISCPQRTQTPSRHITKRREPKAQAMRRRMSRSCNDLTEDIEAKLQINNGRPIPSIRSTPNSPHVKSTYSSTPSQLSRIALPQRKRPFLL